MYDKKCAHDKISIKTLIKAGTRNQNNKKFFSRSFYKIYQAAFELWGG
jgi:hypothetical protein